ncbi:MAG: 2-oxoisovalerate dehydrogenase [Actinomycetota bacterium]|nr:MAG: 2-oxoisovalerate dehydrogenase [Actinomycetota bacterium]
MTEAVAAGSVQAAAELDDGLDMYRQLVLIRVFEERVGSLYSQGEIPGFVHLSVGQEAVAVGACWPLGTHDVITSTHRGHGHCLAKGLDPVAMLAELMGRQTGTNSGRGGSMHIADPTQGIFGANGIVAAGLPIAVGAATASQLRQDGLVTVSFFGDGAVAHGAFHEAVNLARAWSSPVVFVCENNGFAEFSRHDQLHAASLRDRAAGYGIPFWAVDGDDVVAVAELMAEVVAGVRAGAGPAMIEATTYRWRGHYEGDPQRYRDNDALRAAMAERDPIARQRQRLIAEGVAVSRLDEIDDAIGELIDKAVQQARSAAAPDPATLTDYTWRRPIVAPVGQPATSQAETSTAPVSGGPAAGAWTPAAATATTPVFRTMDAVHDALEVSLATDPEVFIAGIDVGAGGNVFGLTRGLHERFGRRVLDTPISETAIVGVAVGAAMAGMRPVVEIMYLDFIGVCFDQIMNQAAKLGYMTGGRAPMGLTIRTQYGIGRSSGSQHSQSLEALLAHVPGLKVVMPATPADTYGLLRAAILDPDPVVVIENRLLYGVRGPRPPEDYVVPIGSAAVVRPGSDLTVVAWSQMVNEALAAAAELATDGIDVEVIDLRTVAPVDYATVQGSVRRTSKLLIAGQGVTAHGLGAEIAARVGADCFADLDGPIVRLGGPASPVPYAPNLEQAWLPGRADIVTAVRELASY